MNLLILPGYSEHNKDWALDVESYFLKRGNAKVLIHEWRHWREDYKSTNIGYEAGKIVSKAGTKKYCVTAKSFGTRVLATLLMDKLINADKVVVCGIPTTNNDARKLYKASFSMIDFNNIICFQNEHDPLSSWGEVSKMIGGINKKIKVIKKPRNDHHYPYYEDFFKFLAKK